jgi:hypothetical protein
MSSQGVFASQGRRGSPALVFAPVHGRRISRPRCAKALWPKDRRGWALMMSRCSSSRCRLPRLWCWRPPGSADARGGDARGQVRQAEQVDASEVVVLVKTYEGCHGRGARERFQTVMQRRPEPSRADWTVIGGEPKASCLAVVACTSAVIRLSLPIRACSEPQRWPRGVLVLVVAVLTELLALCRETVQALLCDPPPLERALRFRVKASTQVPRSARSRCWREWLLRLGAEDIRRRAEEAVPRGPRCWSAP